MAEKKETESALESSLKTVQSLDVSVVCFAMLEYVCVLIVVALFEDRTGHLGAG